MLWVFELQNMGTFSASVNMSHHLKTVYYLVFTILDFYYTVVAVENCLSL